MDKDFARDIKFINQQSELPSFRYRNKRIIECIEEFIIDTESILDIGERSKMTERMENRFNLTIHNTLGDLDKFPYESDIHTLDTNCRVFTLYDLIIFSHVIEHLFNPLLALEKIKSRMKLHSVLVIATPIKPHYLKWGKGHFHEFDEYRFEKLIERAGFRIVKWYKFRNGPWWSDLGIRPLLRKIFFKEQSVVICKNENLEV